MKANENELIGKLELFIRKHYGNLMLRGGILFAAIFLTLFLIISLFEYYAYSNTLVRTLIFYGFLLLNAIVLAGMVLIPFARLKGWLRRMSYEEAAVLIGKSFPEIDDKLLNTLQLHSLSAMEQPGRELLLAAIDKRMAHMRPFRFQRAVSFKKSLSFLKYAAAPALITCLLLLWNAELFTGPTHRILHHHTPFVKPAPYGFVWLNPTDTVVQNSDLRLKVKVEGKETPEEAFAEVDGIRYRMEKLSPVDFEYELKNLRSDTRIRFCGEEARSPEHRIRVLPKPNLLHFSVHLHYPAYLHKIDETIDNNGNVTVPQGTRMEWHFRTAHADEVLMRLDNGLIRIPCADGKGSCRMSVHSDFSYTVSGRNRHLTNPDSLQYFISVIPDAYPEIRVESSKDSLYFDRFYFKGSIRDDYGFTRLQFVYFVTSGKDTVRKTMRTDLPFQTDVTAQNFYYYFDAQTLSLNLGESLHYCFEVWDNDGINGSKCSRSQQMEFRLPSPEEIKEQGEQVQNQTQKELSQTIKSNEDLLQRIDALKKKMVGQKDASWEDQKVLKDMLKQWQELRKEMEEAVEAQKRQQEMEEQYETVSEEILKKQEELQQRMDELFSDEMKQTLMELQRMMEKNIDKDKLNQALEKIRISTEELNKQLDQNLALFKRLAWEQKMEDALDQAEKLAEKQLELSKETAEKKSGTEELENRQKQLQEAFKQLEEDFEELRETDKSMEDPYLLPDTKDKAGEILQEMKQAGENLKKQQQKSASQHQQKAGEKIRQMRQQMEDSFRQSKQQAMAEDIQSVRKILKHIIQTSFQQEKLMKQLSRMNLQDPGVKEVLREQFLLRDNLRMIEDSISAVARRQQAVKPFIYKQIAKINDAQRQILAAIGQSQDPDPYTYYYSRNFNNAVTKQQYVMTALNDLALMLAESIDKMQKQQQQGSGKGKGSPSEGQQCTQGGSGGDKPSKDMKSLREMQEQLNKQLEEMRKQQNGVQTSPSGSKAGKQGSQSEQFARMAAQQEAIRRMTQEKISQLQKEGRTGEASNLQRALKSMEETEKDLVNKILNRETIERQREISTRMLQSERAEMQREKDKQRESRQGRDLQRTPPPDWIQQQQKQQRQTELYRTVPPQLRPFYKQKANQYFYRFE
ncbi:MAG: hypothetical protein J5873_00330 [Bacteroidales bacterium]|nr:hypothetical protein [Bacteroidales bacterium]